MVFININNQPSRTVFKIRLSNIFIIFNIPISNMKDFIKNIFVPKGKPKQNTIEYSNKAIYNELINCFNQNLEKQSVGEKMLYPTYYNVILHPSDFIDIELALPFIVQQTINTFYKIIDTKKNEYKDYEAPSKNWLFHFSPSESIQISEKDENNIKIIKSEPIIMARLYSIGFGNVSGDTNVKVSFKPKNSDTYATFDINQSVFNGINVLAKGLFRVKIDKNLHSLKEPPIGADEIFAEIKFFDKGHKTFKMMDKEIIVSKMSEKYNDTHILQIDSEELIINHARIRYNNTNNIFELSAFEKVRLNEKIVPLSSGNSITWVQLNPESNILLGNFCVLTFIAKK